MELEGYWFFPPWLMVVFHLRASTGGFRCPLPEGLAPLERDYLRLNPLANPLRVDLRPFPPWGCLPLWCCGCHEGVYGRCWRLSEAFQREVSGLVDGAITLYHWNQETGGGRGYPGWSCCQSPVQNPGSESRRSPGASAWWGEISWLPDHPVGPQVFSLELSALRIQRPDPSSPVVLVVRTGTREKKISIFPKQTTWLLGSPIFRFLF